MSQRQGRIQEGGESQREAAPPLSKRGHAVLRLGPKGLPTALSRALAEKKKAKYCIFSSNKRAN